MSDLVKFTQKGWTEAIQKMRKLIEWGENLQPELEKWISFYKGLINKYWGEQGRPYGKRWKGLSDQYSKWKSKFAHSRKADLMLPPSFNLVRAATGGTGWFEKFDNNEMKFGIDLAVIPYARIHQFGGYAGKGHRSLIPERRYMMGGEKDNPMLPTEAYEMFKKLISERWNKAVA